MPGDPEEGRSPRKLRVGTLGDWMKAADPTTRVFAVSAKDRAAITLGGRHPDGAYWLRREGDDPGFTTSRYYQDALPGWAQEWNAAGLAARVPEHWEHATQPSPVGRVDDYPGESDEYSRTSPHPLHDSDPEDLADNVYHSPFVDELTLSFAQALVKAEGLGTRASPDLLAVSLSAIDTVGHRYGPWSLESADTLERLDASLGDFLRVLEDQVGEGRLLVALTSDHGILPLPEWLVQTEKLTCPVAGGRPGLVSFIFGLYWELHFELSPYSWPAIWMDAASQLTVNRRLAQQRNVPVERVVAVAERWLESQPSVREAWTRAEIEQRDSDLAQLYRNSFDPEKSGDLTIQFEPSCLPDFDGSGTSHGSPYAYDRNVPIVFWGAGIEARRVSGRAVTVDIAPSLAARLGIAPPSDLDGRNLLN
jgi:predicted AlkP superfamily pyrophosphatase or phosphodiesterase